MPHQYRAHHALVEAARSAGREVRGTSCEYPRATVLCAVDTEPADSEVDQEHSLLDRFVTCCRCPPTPLGVPSGTHELRGSLPEAHPVGRARAGRQAADEPGDRRAVAG